jgi:predicted ATPase/class 3 adenylate cyclase
MPDFPTGTVTFLFTDLEGSTRLWEQHPTAMPDALARHDAILRGAIEARGGLVVKTTGDGVHAAFGVAGDAVRAAVDAQRELGRQSWDEIGRLRVRMGVHTGSAQHRDGDYFGSVLNRSARIMAAAHGGQILVSLATEELARDAVRDDIALTDLGEHRLRDLDRAERVFQVSAPGLASDFRPLRSIENLPGNLPAPATSFVGRERELEAVREAAREHRLVTLTGVGGVGKTRLALQVAAEIGVEFADGSWLCELAAVDEADATPQAVATALGVQPRPGTSLTESLTDYLGSKRLLLVLDNCEHLLDAAAEQAEAIMAACPGVHVLATSREGLGVAGEHVWPLRSLSVPPASAPVGAVAESDAVRLFVVRARAATPDFEILDSNALAVGELCRRLDGMPLALELAAARVPVMSPAELAARLDERFRVLTGGRRRSVERHQTLRAAIDWSYSLLSDRERTVFDRLGVFVGTFDHADVEAVVSGGDVAALDAVDALHELVAKSMVVAEPTDNGTRYQLLETLRQYAREHLEDRRETEAWRRRHAEHYAGLAEALGPGLRGVDELRARPAIERALDNLRAAVFWALDRDDAGDVELGLRVIAPLLSEVMGNRRAGIGNWALRAVRAEAAPASPNWPTVLVAAGYACFHLGAVDEAGRYATAALSGSSPSPAVLAYGGLLLANLAGVAGDFAEARRRGQEAMDALGDDPVVRWELLVVHAVTAIWTVVGADLDGSRDLADQALAEARALRSPTGLALALFSRGLVAWFHDDYAAALRDSEESAALTEAGANDAVYAGNLYTIALARYRLGEYVRSARALRDSIAHALAIGDRSSAGGPHLAAILLARAGFYLEASRLEGALARGFLAPLTGGIDAAGVADREEAMQAAGAALGERFEVERQRGAAMDYNEIVACALAGLDELTADEP